jgi:hypothetical protein
MTVAESEETDLSARIGADSLHAGYCYQVLYDWQTVCRYPTVHSL